MGRQVRLLGVRCSYPWQGSIEVIGEIAPAENDYKNILAAIFRSSNLQSGRRLVIHQSQNILLYPILPHGH
jgi:hypothetical protein